MSSIPSTSANEGSFPLSPQGQPSPLSPSSHSRRHSSRSIKRKKFDDELVESSLITTSVKSTKRSSDGNPGTPSTTYLPDEYEFPAPRQHEAASQETTGFERSRNDQLPAHVQKNLASSFSANTVKKAGTSERKMGGGNHKKKRMKKTRQAFAAVKDMGRWKPTDDIMLIDAVERLSDLNAVHIAVKFSCYFTLEEVQERWYALLYDPVISGLARQAMKSLPLEIVQQTQAKAVFDKNEEEILCRIKPDPKPTEEDFKLLLEENSDTFHCSRTLESLMKYWHFLHEYHLLPGQIMEPLPCGDHILHFSDAEDLLNDRELRVPTDEVLNNELMLTNKHQLKEIKKLESETQKWQTIVENVTEGSMNPFDSQTIAVLRGRIVRYLMRSREISFGRSTPDCTVDVDMALEGPAFKVSRRHGCIKMKTNGDFVIYNEGKRPVIVDEKPVLTGAKVRLLNNAVVEIGLLRFVFLINLDFIKTLGKKRDT